MLIYLLCYLQKVPSVPYSLLLGCSESLNEQMCWSEMYDLNANCAARWSENCEVLLKRLTMCRMNTRMYDCCENLKYDSNGLNDCYDIEPRCVIHGFCDMTLRNEMSETNVICERNDLHRR